MKKEDHEGRLRKPCLCCNAPTTNGRHCKMRIILCMYSCLPESIIDDDWDASLILVFYLHLTEWPPVLVDLRSPRLGVRFRKRSCSARSGLPFSREESPGPGITVEYFNRIVQWTVDTGHWRTKSAVPPVARANCPSYP